MSLLDETAYIRLEQVSFSYGQGGFSFQDFSVSFLASSCTALMGLNGSGKTTLGKLAAGLLQCQKGEVVVGGHLLSHLTLGSIGKKVGYLWQEPTRQIFGTSVYEDLSFVLRFQGIPEDILNRKVTDLLEYFELVPYQDCSPYLLSRGEQQRLAIAGVLLHDPPFLVWDEPTTGLDSKRKDQLVQLVRKLKALSKGFLVITHDEDFAYSCADRILRLEKGVLVDDFRPSQ